MALSISRASEPELEARLAFLPHIQEDVRAAVRQMQQEGILDVNGRLIPPKELPDGCAIQTVAKP